MRRLLCPASIVAFLFMSTAPAAQQSPRVLLISIDGLMPAAYTEPGPARIPTLRRLARDGAYARGVVGVLPSVTYPSHTTLITGVKPAVHGIIDNVFVDPENKSGRAWFWYARQIKVPTLLGAARAAGLRTASVFWPVTVGAPAHLLFPEYIRSDHPENLEAIRAMSTPNLIDAVEVRRGAPLPWPFDDGNTMEVAAFAAETYRPDLMLVHLIDLDSAQHDQGPGSPEALETLERLDGFVAKLTAAFGADAPDRPVVAAIVSDHGFLPLRQMLQPNALFREEGLLQIDPQGRVTDWQAYFHASGGSGYVYLKPSSDPVLRSRVGGLLETLAADPATGVRTVWSASDLSSAGAHPDAVFGIDMENGFYAGGGHDTLLKPPNSKGGHGFAPDRPELYASLILHGGPFRGRGDLGIVRMTQVAPTLAAVLGIRLSENADSPLAASR